MANTSNRPRHERYWTKAINRLAHGALAASVLQSRALMMSQVLNRVWITFSVVMMTGIPSLATPPLRIITFQKDGTLAWTNAAVPGVCTIERATTPEGPWWPMTNAFTTNSGGQAALLLEEPSQFHRLLAVDIGGTPQGFTNLAYAYGILETIAGTGAGQIDGVSYWQSWNEGNDARWAALSRRRRWERTADSGCANKA